MAKGKKTEKKKKLTPEERLEKVLVPVKEQPYPVPGNWCWCKLAELYQVNPKNIAFDDIDAAFIPMENISAGMVSDFSFKVQPWKIAKKGHTQFANGDIAFAKISPCFENRKSMILDGLPNGIGGGTTELIVLRNHYVFPQYTFWLISDEKFIQGGKQTYSGTVGQQRISMDYVKNYPVPLPPIPEQRRIVNRVESLFTKLDEAKERAQAVVNSFETRKSAILYKAFIGELTAQWRKSHNISLDSWVLKRVNEVCLVRAGYAFDSKKFTNSGYQIVRMGNLHGAELDLSRNPVFIAKDDVEENVLKRSLIHDGDILITLTGTKYKRDYGYAACIVNPDGLLVNQRILCLSPLEDIERNYILYYLQSNIFRDIFFSNETGGVNQGNVSSKFVERIQIQIPTNKEQAEIVHILDSLLAKEKQAKETAETVLDQIDTMKKSILARAFRGELGTNDPAEESAVELLKSVL